MKNIELRRLRILILFAAFMLSAFPLIAEPDRSPHVTHHTQEKVVYITKTGTKYHKSSCRYLSQSKIKMTLKKAVAERNGACKVCKP